MNKNKFKVLELFAGIGACSKALKRAGIDIEIVDAVEIDKFAIASFNAIHGTNFEVQDICEWNKDLKDIDLITHGSPCQDFSVAGKQAGGDLGSGTRSSLMYETIRIVGKIRPKYVLWENVKNILSKKHKHNFDTYIETMSVLGYNSYYKVLNAKDYGIPQNRERVYTISIRRDLDKFNFVFPEKEELNLKLKDILEEEVEEKYYLSDKFIEGLIKHNENHKKNGALAPTDNTIKVVGELDIKGHDCVKRIYGVDGISPTLTDMQGGNRQPKIITYNIPQKVKVRKYPVDIDKLKDVLRTAKAEVNMTNNELAEKLKIPKTQVEHYFRKDDCFAIPDPEIWYKLKELLKIDTDKFDESIMTFEKKDGVYDKANRVYDEQGLAPTLTLQETVTVAMRGRYDENRKVEQQIEIEKIDNFLKIKNATKKGYDEATDGDSVNLQYPDSDTRRGRVGHGVSQTIQCNDSMGVVEKARKDIKEKEKYCEYCGKKLERKRFNGRLEDFTVFKNRKYCNRECMKKGYLKIGDNHNQTYSNAHTTARKINELILHKEECELCGSRINLDIHHIDGNWQNNNLDNLMCLCRSCHTKYERNKNKTNNGLRIRKLTPREVWRLMRI